MRKFLIALALIASPATAQEIVAPGPNATFEERLAYIRALRIQSEENHKKVVAENEQRMREANIRMGLPADYQNYGSGIGCRSVCVTTVISGGKVYRFRVSRF